MPVHLQREIEELKKKILKLGAMVEENLRMSVDSLWKTSEETIEKIEQHDEEVDLMEVKIEEDCLKLLALHQPVAIDLRFIIAVLKINNDLERVSDLAVNITKQGRHLKPESKGIIDFDFTKMAEVAQKMLKEAIDSLINLDVKLAHQVILEDDTIDDLHKEIYTLIKKYIESTGNPNGCAINLFQVSRILERIGDLATNIAEDIIYMIEGKIVRHKVSTPLDKKKTSQ